MPNHKAIIVLMNIAVNEHMGIPEGRRKDASAEKLKDAFDHLDAIGDGLVRKIRAALKPSKSGG